MNPAIIEKKPPTDFFLHAKPTVGKIPDEIKPLMDLMGLTAACYMYEEVRIWSIDNPKTLKYVRIDAETLGQDEDKWREVMGLLIDFGNGQIK
jgi:hypothetical protein